jgi:hypothetical protein
MSVVINFPYQRVETATLCRAAKREAEIVIFPGVRIERAGSGQTSEESVGVVATMSPPEREHG